MATVLPPRVPPRAANTAECRCSRYDAAMRSCVLVLAMLATGCPRSGVPAPDSCVRGAAGAVTALELGPGGSGEDTPFSPWRDGDVVTPVFGGQGFTMVVLRMRVTGAAPPTCLAQETYVRSATSDLASSNASVKTYADGAARTTHSLFIPASFPAPGEPLLVEVHAGGLTVKRSLFSESAPPDQAVPTDLAVRDLAAGD